MAVLNKPLARRLTIGEQEFKIVISPDGVKITPKGKRNGSELTWDALIALGDGSRVAAPVESSSKSDLPRAIATDVAVALQTATNAIGKARSAMAQVGAVPASLLREVEADRTYGRSEEEDHWYIEPLLTPPELASLLRIAPQHAHNIDIPRINTPGGWRYRQSEVRKYLTKNTEKGRGW